MQVERSHRGWVAAITVALTLTLVFLAVEKHIRDSGFDFRILPQASHQVASTTEPRGILLTLDPGIAVVESFPSPHRTGIARTDVDTNSDQSTKIDGIVGLLRRPFEPAAQVVLRAPTSSETDALPLHIGSDDADYLVEALTRAFESPMRQVSSTRTVENAEAALDTENSGLRPMLSGLPNTVSGVLPEPRALFAEIAQLSAPAARLVSHRDAFEIQRWSNNAQQQLRALVDSYGQPSTNSPNQFQALRELIQQASEIAGKQADYTFAAKLLQTAYSIERRIAIWEAVHNCLSHSSAQLDSSSPQHASRQQVMDAIAAVSQDAQSTGDQIGWHKFLLLDEIAAWASSPDSDWETGHQLALKALSRMKWNRMTAQQREFVMGESSARLAELLTVWSARPVDYRRLLTDLETVEEDPLNRCRGSLAAAVQTLSLSAQSAQSSVASAVNDHYRNANIRLSVAGELLERMLPSSDWSIRPVRQRILGAETRGNSKYKTQLRVQLIPDESAWHVALGVTGDLHSTTQANKDPAIVHTTSVAQISTGRTIRMTPNGYEISGTHTNVESRQFLRGLSTHYDSLPIIGEFVRVLVREKFNEQRPVAQRIVNGMIARETDQELDKQLNASLAQAEKEISERLIGPLESLNLDPMVATMNTTKDRLAVRYRVASHGQMAAHTARPRAPSDSLLSMQLHESAINNTIAKIGLEGKLWTLPELTKKLAGAFRQDQWKLPDDAPQDISIRFADSRPITVQLSDGRLELTLRIAELSQTGRMRYERFIVKTRYVPVADGMYAALVRDEDDYISVDGPRLRAMQELAVRAIFAKIFVSRSTFPLISPKWKDDQRAQGLAVSQVEVRDGWLALAISDQQSPHVARTAAAARELLVR